MEDARQELIALSGVPAPYLGYGQVVELQSQLVHVNLSFATEIADIQESVTKELNRMIDYIAQELDFQITPSDYISISMIPPVVLMLQLIEMTAGSANNIIGVFQSLQLPIDPISFLKKYIPLISRWNEKIKKTDGFTSFYTSGKNLKTKKEFLLFGIIIYMKLLSYFFYIMPIS